MYLWIMATVVAFFVKGLCGFANTLVFTSIMGFGTSNINISPVELLTGYPTNIILTWKNREKLSRKIYLPLIAMVLFGSINGALLLRNMDVRYAKVVFGFIVILFGVDVLVRELDLIHFKESKVMLGVIGVLSGVLCGLFGVGALLASYVSRVSRSDEEFKANLSAVFIAENTFRIISYSFLGIISLANVRQAVVMLPFMIIGLFAGIKSGEILDEKYVKWLVVILLIVSGIVMIWSNI